MPRASHGGALREERTAYASRASSKNLIFSSVRWAMRDNGPSAAVAHTIGLHARPAHHSSPDCDRQAGPIQEDRVTKEASEGCQGSARHREGHRDHGHQHGQTSSPPSPRQSHRYSLRVHCRRPMRGGSRCFSKTTQQTRLFGLLIAKQLGWASG